MVCFEANVRAMYIIIIIYKYIVKLTSYFQSNWRNGFRSADPIQYAYSAFLVTESSLTAIHNVYCFLLIENIRLPYY